MNYDRMIETARAFYAELAANNSKVWWDAHRDTYDLVLKPHAQALLDELAPKLERLVGAKVTPKIFRPYRDVRFSKDKTPYSTHLHMAWMVNSGTAVEPAFFFGISPAYVTVGGGLMGFDKPVLDTWRQMVDLDGDRIAAILRGVGEAGFTLEEPSLKRVPSPYGADHAHGGLLRMKGVVATKPLGLGPIPEALLSAFTALRPLNALLVEIGEA